LKVLVADVVDNGDINNPQVYEVSVGVVDHSQPDKHFPRKTYGIKWDTLHLGLAPEAYRMQIFSTLIQQLRGGVEMVERHEVSQLVHDFITQHGIEVERGVTLVTYRHFNVVNSLLSLPDWGALIPVTGSIDPTTVFLEPGDTYEQLEKRVSEKGTNVLNLRGEDGVSMGAVNLYAATLHERYAYADDEE